MLQDANFNITAVTNEAGVVQERYLYDPYGERTTIDADWSSDADGDSDVDWVYGFQGLRHEEAVGLKHARFRDLTRLGRWNRQDPLQYIDGASLYSPFHFSPITKTDVLGLLASPPMEDIDRQIQSLERQLRSRRYQRRGLEAAVPGAAPAYDFQDYMMDKYVPSRNLHEAARHVYWQAYLEYWYWNWIAIGFGWGKEMTDFDDLDGTRDDLNNRLGRHIGSRATSLDDLKRRVEDAIVGGRARGIVDGEIVNFYPQRPIRPDDLKPGPYPHPITGHGR